MVPAQQDSVSGQPHASRRLVDKVGKLARRLSSVTTQLIDLTGSGLYVEDRIVFHGLLNGRVDDPGMRGTSRIHSAVFRDTVAVHNLAQVFGGAAAFT